MTHKFRADIDGLRAIAVLLVIFNHLGWSVFSGGYIGVDIFFVISGYLITLILMKDLSENRFSIGHFYKKRVIRLAPALFTVITTVSIIAWQVMLPDEIMKYAESVVYSTFMMANIFMSNEVGDYFSQNVESIPLLHLWSLGVEEQFYIFWPIILLLLFKCKVHKWIMPVVIIGIVISLFYAEQQLKINADKAYYSMPVRAFELLLGALIVFLPKIKISRIYSQILVWVGLLTIAITAFYFNKNTPFPGWLAFIPCLATGLIIYLGQSDADSNFVLNNRMSLWIGKISYPLYLWHWPVIVFSSFYLISNTFFNQLILLSLSILLAWLTYKIVEQPSKRFVAYTTWKVISVGFILPALTLTTVAQATEWKVGFPHRFSQTVQQQLDTLNSFAHLLRRKCIGYPSASTFSSAEICQLGIEKPEVDFMLIGDSHANSASGMLNIWAKNAGLRGYDVTQSSTLYLPNTDRMMKINAKWKNHQEFKRRNDAITLHLKQHHYPIIILTGYYYSYLGSTLELTNSEYPTANKSELLYQGLKLAVQNAEQASDQVIMLLDIPKLKDIRADCILRAEVLERKEACTFSIMSENQIKTEFEFILTKLKKDFPKLKFIDPKNLLCSDDICQSSIKGLPIYRNKDDHHLSYKGSEALGYAYLETFGNPLK